MMDQQVALPDHLEDIRSLLFGHRRKRRRHDGFPGCVPMRGHLKVGQLHAIGEVDQALGLIKVFGFKR